MWVPPQRIKHTLPEGNWPSREEARDSLWFSPLRVGNLALEQRTWIPAMVPWRSNEEGEVTRDVLDYYERYAQGFPGALVVEATGVRDIPSGPLLRIGHDRYLPGLRKLVEVVRQASQGRTRLFIQIIDFLGIRRRPEPAKFFARFLDVKDRHRQHFPDLKDDEIRQRLAAEPALWEQVLDEREYETLQYGWRERVTDLDTPAIRELPQSLPPVFAAAAVRAREAGFDGVELHYAHAYTMASFLSGRNDRKDGYGSTREGRLRLPLEVFREVRRRVGDDYTVGCRYLAHEGIQGGYSQEDACFYGVELARAGMDFLSLSRGGKFEDAKQPAVGWAVYPYTGPSGYECMPSFISDERGPWGRNVPSAGPIRAAVREAGLETPVVVTGGICSFTQAEELLRSGQADIIGSARQSLADPDWFHKVALGRGEEVRRCKFSNYCEGLDQKHKQVTCQCWDRLELDEPGVALAEDGRRRLLAPSWKP
ncbi:MAG: NADH:flavin oxidoreductase [Candidatus Eremiobacteraeota bacterium]|nr:NADH:flavin oxidoreductase [Candidatus Eremiobacteraeota bacterium]MCW5865970.1 NADH:flavin oxidoreductase [Candidatus Eremiobacteraeota bacterium]